MDSKHSPLPESDFGVFHKNENTRIATVNMMLSLLAVALGALAVVVAVLVAFDARNQLDELNIRIQLEKDLRLRARAKHAEREDWFRENRDDSIDVDDDDNWLTNRFRRELEWETFDGETSVGGGTRKRRDSSSFGAPIPTCNCDDSEPRMREQKEQYRLSIFGELSCTSK